PTFFSCKVLSSEIPDIIALRMPEQEPKMNTLKTGIGSSTDVFFEKPVDFPRHNVFSINVRGAFFGTGL
ncbi:MAG TPA: hypothetical protein PL176_09405, partial [Kiritimatiellia bacterium]|nr:hypothetical protein [Kiritimatiellia bacterium]